MAKTGGTPKYVTAKYNRYPIALLKTPIIPYRKICMSVLRTDVIVVFDGGVLLTVIVRQLIFMSQ